MNVKKVILGLGFLLILGNGLIVAAGFDKGWKAYESGDYKTAIAEWTPLAEQGDVFTQFILGTMYDDGKGVAKNFKKAVKWYTLAAEQGDAEAQFYLGNMYNQKLERSVENDKTARKWNELAAEQGHGAAQNNLGFLYSLGVIVPTDTKRGYMWFNLAAHNGNLDAAGNREKLTKQMTNNQIAAALEMSNVCLKSDYTDC